MDQEPEIRAEARRVANRVRQAISAGDGQEDIVNLIHKAMVESHKQGIRKYAWWKDGTEFVGSGAHTLKDAHELVDKREGIAFSEM